MKNYAEQQMGAVLNPYENHPDMNRTMATAADEVPRDIAAAARKVVIDDMGIDVPGKYQDAMVGVVADAIFAERQRAVDIVERYELIIAWQPATSSGSEGFGRPFQSVLSKQILGADQ